MEHSYFKDRISAFKDNGLNTEEQYLISLHLKECAECRALLEKLEALDSMVARESELSPDEYFEKLASRIDKKITGDSAKVTDISTRSSWAGLTWKITATAASVAFLVFIGYHKDDILPPSKSVSESESPVIMAPGSAVKVDSIRVKRQDLAEDQSASFSSPKPSPAKLRSPSAADGYSMNRDALGKNEAQGDVRLYDSEQERLEVKLGKVQRKKKTISEKSSIVKKSSAKEKMFIRGGRSNEVAFEVDDIDLDKAEESPKGLLQEAERKVELPKVTTNAPIPVPESEQDNELDSNYKRVRKSGQVLKEAVEEKFYADDSGIIDEVLRTDDKPIVIASSRWDDAVESYRKNWLKARDSLVATISKTERLRVQNLNKNYLSKNYDEDSRIDKNYALELELLELLQIVIQTSEDSLETQWAVNMTRQLAQFGYAETNIKAKFYLDSLNAARTKRDKERK